MPIEMPVRFIAGFVKDVFVSEQPVAAQKTSPSVYARAELFKILPMTLRGLLKLWGSEERSDSTPDELHNKYTVQDHITHILDPIFAKFPTELLFSVCCLWEQDKGTSSNTLQTVLLQILSSLDSIRHEIVFQSLTTIVTNVLRERARISRRGTATGDTIASVPMHETTVLVCSCLRPHSVPPSLTHSLTHSRVACVRTLRTTISEPRGPPIELRA